MVLGGGGRLGRGGVGGGVFGERSFGVLFGFGGYFRRLCVFVAFYYYFFLRLVVVVVVVKGE